MSAAAGGFRSRARSGQSQRPGRTKAQKGKQGAPSEKQQNNQKYSKRQDRNREHQAPAGVDKPRLVAFEVLNRVSDDDAYANLILPKFLRQARLKGRDAAFATEITYGCLRCLGIIDTVLEECSSRELESLATAVLNSLRLGAYQLLFTRVDDHAAVDTSVRLVETAGHSKAKGFVNGILRTIGRTPKADWMSQLRPDGELAGLAFANAHPEWIARSFNAALWATSSENTPSALGIGNRAVADAADAVDSAAATRIHPELGELLAADSERPVVHLVARPGEISAEELALMIGGETARYSPYAVYLESGGNPGALEPVQQSLAAVQDEGSQLIARAVAQAEVSGNDSGRWLDLCAGPGGKAALLGALAGIDGATVDAVEISPHRAELIRSTVGDLPVTVYQADGRDPGLKPGYDRVLVDAPCSGLGALRRRPEARWKKDDADIEELNVVQVELLRSALRLVRPGGVVVYSTCSPDLRETREIVDAVMSDADSPDLEELSAASVLPPMPGIGGDGAFRSAQMWPHRHGTDAMFFAVLRRKPE